MAHLSACDYMLLQCLN